MLESIYGYLYAWNKRSQGLFFASGIGSMSWFMSIGLNLFLEKAGPDPNAFWE